MPVCVCVFRRTKGCAAQDHPGHRTQNRRGTQARRPGGIANPGCTTHLEYLEKHPNHLPASNGFAVLMLLLLPLLLVSVPAEVHPTLTPGSHYATNTTCRPQSWLPSTLLAAF